MGDPFFLLSAEIDEVAASQCYPTAMLGLVLRIRLGLRLVLGLCFVEYLGLYTEWLRHWLVMIQLRTRSGLGFGASLGLCMGWLRTRSGRPGCITLCNHKPDRNPSMHAPYPPPCMCNHKPDRNPNTSNPDSCLQHVVRRFEAQGGGAGIREGGYRACLQHVVRRFEAHRVPVVRPGSEQTAAKAHLGLGQE